MPVTYTTHIYTVSGKNIPNIIDCHLKKRYPILISLGMNNSGTTGHQIAVQYSTLPNAASALFGENRTNKIWAEINKKICQKASPTLSIV